jgi:1-acyl-sn-glycerol-3-phosphate acyltransferase
MTQHDAQTFAEASPAWIAATRVVGTAYFGLLHRIRHIGAEHIPASGPLLVVSNHPTYLDPVMIGLATRRIIHWVAWEGLFKWPVIGPILPRVGAIPLNTARPHASSLKRCLEVLDRQRALGLFFEGRRSNSPSINPPLRGAARLALRSGAPILPVSITGAFHCWPKTRVVPRPGRIVVIFHPVLQVDRALDRRSDREDELNDRLLRIIGSRLTADGTAETLHGPPRAANGAAAHRENHMAE